MCCYGVPDCIWEGRERDGEWGEGEGGKVVPRDRKGGIRCGVVYKKRNPILEMKMGIIKKALDLLRIGR